MRSDAPYLDQRVDGTDAPSILEIEALHEPEGGATFLASRWGEATDEPAREDARPTNRFMDSMCNFEIVVALMNQRIGALFRAAGWKPAATCHRRASQTYAY